MEIYKKLSGIQCELVATKGQYNNFGKYSYRSCEDILEAVKPLLDKYKVAIVIKDIHNTHLLQLRVDNSPLNKISHLIENIYLFLYNDEIL